MGRALASGLRYGRNSSFLALLTSWRSRRYPMVRGGFLEGFPWDPFFGKKKTPQKWPPKLIMQNRPGWIPPSPGNVPQAAPLCSGLRGHPGGASGTGGDRQPPPPPGWSNMPSCVDGTERRHFPPISSITSPSTPPPALLMACARVSVTLYMSRTRHLPAGSIPRAPASPHPGMLLPPKQPGNGPNG